MPVIHEALVTIRRRRLVWQERFPRGSIRKGRHIMYLIMTPGPTEVRENVRAQLSRPCTNPDLDPSFYEFYHETCGLLEQAFHTDSRAFILDGEGMLGLEAEFASLTEPGDRVLVISNGIFGKGNADLIKIYGGETVLYEADWRRPLDPDDLRSFLKQDHDFKYAAVVHCDTPTGVLNDILAISRLLDEYGIMTVADSVSAMFAVSLDLSEGSIDILCGGSQKALSAPPGLSTVHVSERAFRSMKNRKTPIASFYANLLLMEPYYENRWFPYTMPIADLHAFRQALDNFLADPDVFKRHAAVAEATRTAAREAGLKLYLDSGFSDSVTVLEIPEGITYEELFREMLEHNVMIAGAFDELQGRVIRIGHMGENCRPEKVGTALAALDAVLTSHGIHLDTSLSKAFYKKLYL
jgi:aspartate aminotransferase-like enzyme